MRYAFKILALSKISGLHVLFEIMSPKYLNSFNISIYLPFSYIWPLQFTNMAYVFSRFMLSVFSAQNS